MDGLTAALAFATTMLFFALVVSSLVEMIHRFLGLRERGLHLMLESIYDQVIAAYVKRADPNSALTGSQFADAIMANRAVSKPSADGTHLEASSSLSKSFARWLSATTMSNVPVEMFAQKLAARVSFAENEAAAIMQDISQKYVAFGAEASEYFRRRARLLSVLVAFPVAFLFYVQPYDLAQAFLRDPALARKVAEQSIVLLEPPESIEVAKPTEINHPKNNQASTQANKQADAPAEISKQTGDDNAEVARLKAELATLKEGFRRWDELGLPVGWPDKLGMSKCSEAPASGGIWKSNCTRQVVLMGDVAIPSLAQLFWLFVGALLVGLGAPFWAQAVGALTVSKGAVEKIGAIVDGNEASSNAVLAEAPTHTSPRKSTPVRSYEVAQTARRVANTPG